MLLHGLVIPDAAISAFTRVFDALWRRSGIQDGVLSMCLDSGAAPSARPGTTAAGLRALHHAGPRK
jgi:hypothetical protein